MVGKGEAQGTKMSSKGQGEIPEEIRESLGLKAGSVFAVFSRKDADAILLKKLVFPEPARAFDEMAKWGRTYAKSTKIDTRPERIVEQQHKHRREKHGSHRL